MAWLYVPGLEGWSSESGSPSEATAPSVTSSGKPTPRPLSWRGWKKRPWVALLYGTISQPSTAALGVASWISSLRDSLASRSAQPASSSGSTTSGGYGHSWSESLGKFGPDGSFSKTCLDLFGTDSDPSSVAWPSSGTMQSGACSARTASAPPMNGDGSSSWATPTEWLQEENPETWERRRQDLAAKGYNANGAGRPLDMQASSWPSPRAEDSEAIGNHPGQRDSLYAEVQQWPTPVVPNGGRTTNTSSYREDGSKRQVILDAIVQHWPTPTAGDANSSGSRNTGTQAHNGVSLTDMVTTGDSVGRDSHSFPPVPAISSCGSECSPKHRRLNPLFVEWLMGWPIGWTSVQTDSGSQATGLSLWRSRMRFALSRLVAPNGRRSS